MSLRYTLEIDGVEERDLGFIASDSMRHLNAIVGLLSPGSLHRFRVKATDRSGNTGPYSEPFYQATAPYSDPLLTAFSWKAYHDAEAMIQPNNSDVNEFTDYSGNDAHFLKTGPTIPVPTFLTNSTPLNGKKAVRFGNGLADQSLEAFWHATGECTLFFVANIPELINSTNYLFGDRDTGSDYLFYGNTPDGSIDLNQVGVNTGKYILAAGTHIFRIEHATSSTHFYVDGVDCTLDSTKTKKPGNRITMGAVPAWGVGMWADVHIGVVACSDGLITGTDADTCEAYWIDRYGL